MHELPPDHQPSGFAFEHYDAMGAWRPGQQTVDSSGASSGQQETFTWQWVGGSPWPAVRCARLLHAPLSRYALGIQLEEHDQGAGLKGNSEER